jgi:hypothetical protein
MESDSLLSQINFPIKKVLSEAMPYQTYPAVETTQ